MGALARQTWTLHKKNIRITIIRRWFSTIFRAFLLPVIFVGFISYSRNLLASPVTYGIGSATPIKDLSSTLAAHSDRKFVLVSNNLGGDVQELVDELAGSLRSAGGNVVILQDPLQQLQDECRQTIRGSSNCFAAVVFHGSPGTTDAAWNYTLRGDSAFSFGTVNVAKHDGDVQTFLLPVMLAVDKAIANKARAGSADDIVISEYMYTDQTQKEYDDEVRVSYMTVVVDVISIALFLGHVGIIYHQTGFAATEREHGISTLLEAMGVSKAARILSYHTSFSSIYFLGWVVMGATISNGLFTRTSPALVIVWFVLTGWACASWSIFAGAFFKRAQLSGITATIVTLAVGVLAQTRSNDSTGAVAVMSLLFPSCNFVFMSIQLGRFEMNSTAGSLLELPQPPPDDPKKAQNSVLPGIALLAFLVVQIFVYPLLAALVEKWLYGTGSGNHKPTTDPNNAVELRGFTKNYAPSIIGNLLSGGKKETVTAVRKLDIDVRQGQVLVLLGANGSGKTTTLEAISGLAKVSEGEILINAAGNGHIGICPQKNVFWDELTVTEHIHYWNKLKCAGDSKETLRNLIASCDLTPKKSAYSRNLSGGQKRKLQLAIMFTGGSTICAIDEVSSGLDPLSRRKIWDIILAARGERTIILTTHFLDEADLLADDIAVLSKGALKCKGSAVELKSRMGGGYRVNVPRTDAPELDGIPTKRMYDQTVYNVPDSTAAGRVVDRLEALGVEEYHVSGPTIEDVFLKVAEEAEDMQQLSDGAAAGGEKDEQGVNLYAGRRLGVPHQTWVMFRKRLTILRRNYFPVLVSVVLPIVVVFFCMTLLEKFERMTCVNTDLVETGYESELTFQYRYNLFDNLVLGPQSRFKGLNFTELLGGSDPAFGGAMFAPVGGGDPSIDGSDLSISGRRLAPYYVDTITQYNDFISTNYMNISVGGFFLNENGTPAATYSFLGNFGIHSPMTLQNIVSNMVLGQDVVASYAEFDTIWGSRPGSTLQFLVYLGLVFALFPTFFVLYPTVERIRHVRALHYSNGVRALPLWLAYMLFDIIPILVVAAASSAIMLTTGGNIWYNFRFFPVVMVLYGIASILLAYNVSLIAKSQLSAFAFLAGGQAVVFLLYFIAIMLVFTYSSLDNTDEMLLIVHFSLAIISPIANFTRAVFVVLNMFSISCDGKEFAGNPGSMKLYGGPIAYLILQSLFLFGVLLWWDSGRFRLPMWGGSRKVEAKSSSEEEYELGTLGAEKRFINEEVGRVGSSDDGLKVMHLTKSFGRNMVAVDDVTFGVPRGEVFALLGPNGAGKTTTINMIRGDMFPDSGEIFVENISVQGNRPAARAHLGVCPQFDAMDRMTVVEHLRFYASIRGVKDIEHNVVQVMKAVGLEDFKTRMAEKLSGGNKRKLSLGIALMGNPTVLLLDEPSSGMDAASKRIMWKTLAGVTNGRSLVLTTHSMEEADALASRAGILAKGMLAVGTGEELRKRWGNGYHVHLVLKSAPASTADEMANLKIWVLDKFRGAILEDRSFHGQMRFSVPVYRGEDEEEPSGDEDDTIGSVDTVGAAKKGKGVNRVFKTLEASKGELGLEYYSVSQSTLDQVFLKIVGDADVAEEGYGKPEKKKRWWKRS